jgi:Spy/CpxP family protein refolding chaperone
MKVTGVVAGALVATLAIVQVDAQGRRGPGGQSGFGQGQGRAGVLMPGRGRGSGAGSGGQFMGRGGRGARSLGMGRGLSRSPLAGLGRVGLTDDQRVQLRGILESARDGGRDSMAALIDARRALHDAIFAVTPDAGAIASLQAKVADAEASQLAVHVKTQTAIAAMLTPEQKAKLGKPGPPK